MSKVMKVAALLLLIVAAGLIGLAIWLGMNAKPVSTPVVVEPLAMAIDTPPLYPVVVVAKALKAGERLSADHLELVHWPVVPSQAYDNIEALDGKVLRYDVELGTPVLSSSLTRSLASYLELGERAVTIPVDVNSGANNRVSPGDMVDVFFTFSSGSEVSNTQARLLMPRVRVLAYGRDSLAGPEQAESGPARQDTQARNAMLAVSEEAVNELLLAARSGSLQLVLRSADDESVPNLDLFPEFSTLMSQKKELNGAQKQALQEPANRAWAGLSLREFSLSTERPNLNSVSAVSPGVRTGRSVEVIRGGQVGIQQF